MKKILKLASILLIAGLAFMSCEKPQVDSQPQTSKIPRVNAGDDQIIILPTDSIILNGWGSVEQGLKLHYEWINVRGPFVVSIGNANNAQAIVKNMARGIYEFELKVTDKNMLFARDRVIVKVLDSLTDPLNSPNPWDY